MYVLSLFSVISHNGVNIDCDINYDPVHYGIIYAHVCANDVAQQLFYNMQGFNLYDNNKCNNINQCDGDENDVAPLARVLFVITYCN